MKLKHVQRIKARGRTYYYWRPTGKPFKAAFGTPAFIAEHAALLAKHQNKAEELPGTLGALILAYRKPTNPEWAQLAAATKVSYERAFKVLEAGKDELLTNIDAPAILKLRDRVFRKRKRWMANYVVEVLSILFDWGIPRGYMTTNPAAAVPVIRRPASLAPANRPWSLAELGIVAAQLPPNARVALFLGYFVMLRIGDVLSLDWQSYNGLEIDTIQHKTGQPVCVMAKPALRRVLNPIRKKSGPIVVNRFGEAYTVSGFQSILHRVLRDLEKKKLIRKGLTFHGLRKSLPTNMAEGGLAQLPISAALGHIDARSSDTYIAAASRKRMARVAMATLDGQGETKLKRKSVKQ